MCLSRVPKLRNRKMLSSACSNDMIIFMRCFIFFVFFYPFLQNGYCDNSLESLVDTSANSTQNTNDDDGTTSEIHYTTCKITTEKLSVDAQAKFTRILTGPCAAKTIEDRFERLEKLLSERLSELRELIIRSIMKPDKNLSEANEDAIRTKLAYTKKNRFKENLIDIGENEFAHRNRNNLESFVRQQEIDRYNNTVHEDKQRKFYTYYWRVSNLSEKLSKWETGRSERSSSFYVADAGYAMYLRFTPKYFPDGTIFISVGLTSGYNDSKIVWPFPLPIRIEILDLTPRTNEAPKDRSSRLWDPATVCSSYFWGRPRRIIIEESSDNPECVGLSVPRQLLTSSNNKQTNFSPSYFASTRATAKYLSNNSLIVKLTVYL